MLWLAHGLCLSSTELIITLSYLVLHILQQFLLRSQDESLHSTQLLDKFEAQVPRFCRFTQFKHNKAELPQLLLNVIIQGDLAKSYLRQAHLLLLLKIRDFTGAFDHLLFKVDQIMEDAHYRWIHTLEEHDLVDGLHYLPQKCDLYFLLTFSLSILNLVIFGPHDFMTAFQQEIFNLVLGCRRVSENILVAHGWVLVFDLVLDFIGFVNRAELFYYWQVFFDYLRNILRGAAQFCSYKDKSLTKITQCFSFHIHGISLLVRFDVELHDKRRQRLEFNLIYIFICLKKFAKLLASCNILYISNWDSFVLLLFIFLFFLVRCILTSTTWVRTCLILVCSLDHFYQKFILLFQII